jgi:hypothetical protein
LISGTQIHHWLQQPDLLLQEDNTALKKLEQDYPYFSLAPLMAHYQQLVNVVNLDLLEIYGYNHVVFHYWKDKEETWATLISQEVADAPEAVTEKALEEPLVADNVIAEEDFFTHELTFDAPAVDYFAKQGIDVSADLPEKEDLDEMTFPHIDAQESDEEDVDKSLLVVMSFAEWLQFLQHKTRHEQQEEQEKSALKAMWQRQKLAEALEEESDEIPASVFEMAVNSISREDGVVSESMAIVYAKQGKIRESIEMYQKLCLKNPDKSVYFAQKIENLQKELK